MGCYDTSSHRGKGWRTRTTARLSNPTKVIGELGTFFSALVPVWAIYSVAIAANFLLNKVAYVLAMKGDGDED